MTTATLNRYTVKILSLTLILWGSFGLFLDINSLWHTLDSYNHHLPLETLEISQMQLLSQLFLVSLVNTVSTAFGVFLIFKPTRLRQLTNLILGFGLLTLSTYLGSHADLLIGILSHLNF